MSVLIEALCMVVRKSDLEERYPGGTTAYYDAVLALDRPPRFVAEMDPHLVSLSFYDGEHANPAFLLLAEHGFEESRDRHAADVALVDQRLGPALDCDWLAWRTHPDGFTYAWAAGTEPGDMAAPEGWTPEQSRALNFTDIREEPGRSIRLGEENGIESWLDFATGRIHSGRASTPSNASSSSPVGARRTAEVRRGVEALGWKYVETERGIQLNVRGKSSGYVARLLVDERNDVVSCFVSNGTLVPDDRRPAVAEALARINWRLRLGCFEMDWSDGELQYRSAVVAAGGSISEAMVKSLLFAGLSAHDRYHAALMRVVYAGADPQSSL